MSSNLSRFLRAGLAVSLTALLITSASARTKPSQRAGYIPNEFVDTVIDEPLADAKSIFDVYQVMVNHLSAVYPADSEAGKAIAKFGDFVASYRDMEANDPEGDFAGDGAQTVEMPMNIDQFVHLLRADAPGVDGRPFPPQTAKNVKAQLYTAALLPFIQSRGITYRIRPMVERSFVLHTAAINYLRALRHELTTNGGANAMALFKFVTYPMAQKGRSSVQWHKPSEVQSWLEKEFIPTLSTSIGIVEHALSNASPGQLESFDLTIFLKADNPFPDASLETAYRTGGEPEIQNLLANMYGARAAAHAACAYHLDDFAEASNTFSRVHLNNFLREKVPFGKKPRIGTPSYIRYKIFRDFPELFTLRSSEHSRAALADARKGWDHFDAAMAGYYAASPKDERMVNLRWLQSTYKEYETKIAPQIRAALAGPATITDYIGGATIDIDVPAIFNNPPQDLKDFFPVQFSQDKPHREFEFSSGRLAYSNYDFGNPIGWNPQTAGSTWKRLFPNMSDERGPDGHWIGPMRAYRDIQRTYLGPFMTGLFVAVVD